MWRFPATATLYERRVVLLLFRFRFWLFFSSSITSAPKGLSAMLNSLWPSSIIGLSNSKWIFQISLVVPEISALERKKNRTISLCLSTRILECFFFFFYKTTMFCNITSYGYSLLTYTLFCLYKNHFDFYFKNQLYKYFFIFFLRNARIIFDHNFVTISMQNNYVCVQMI